MSLVPGVVTELLPGVRRIVAPNPSVMTGPGTNTYLLGTTDLIVIDPGPNDTTHLDRIAEIVGDRLRYVVVTHVHSDHAPGARPLATRTGATFLAKPDAAGLDPDGALGDGDTVYVNGFRLQALHTPGHASGHLCFLLEREAGLSPSRVLFSGDHVMGGSTVVIAPLDGDMGDYLASCQRLLELDPPLEAIAPGHGELMDEPLAVIRSYLSHRREREQLVLEALVAHGPGSASELLGAVYGDIAPNLVRPATRTLWAHLRKLGDDGRAACPEPDQLEGRWVANDRVSSRSA